MTAPLQISLMATPTLEGSDPPLEFMETEASDEAAPEDDGTASGAPSDSDEPAGSAAVR